MLTSSTFRAGVKLRTKFRDELSYEIFLNFTIRPTDVVYGWWRISNRLINFHQKRAGKKGKAADETVEDVGDRKAIIVEH